MHCHVPRPTLPTTLKFWALFVMYRGAATGVLMIPRSPFCFCLVRSVWLFLSLPPCERGILVAEEGGVKF